MNPLTPLKAYRIHRYVYRRPIPRNGTQFRNRVNQAAHRYKVTERKVHAALFHMRVSMR